MDIAPLPIEKTSPHATPSVPPTARSASKWYIRGTVIAAVLATLIGSLWYSLSQNIGEPAEMLPTYFTYSQAETDSLKGLTSAHTISVGDIYASDQLAFDLVAKNTPDPTFAEETSKIYAYVAVAERDFAFLSYNASGRWSGSAKPLVKQVLCLFFKNDCASIAVDVAEDAYTQAISALVLSKINARIAEDTAGLKTYPLQSGEAFWDGPQPSIGLTNGSSKGWFIASGSAFRPPPPPAYESEEFAAQVKMTRDALNNATPEQKRATVFWAGVPGTKTPPGQILHLGDAYMQEKAVALPKALLVRSVLAMAVADAVTAVFDSKYFYQVKRPFMMDSSIKTIMPTPNHPSYAAGHSALSTAGATVLKYYFPEDTDMWEAKAYEAGMSRIWGGIHYVMDHDAGVAIGRSVGAAATDAPSSR